MATKSGKADTQPVIDDTGGEPVESVESVSVESVQSVESVEPTDSPVLEVDAELFEATRDVVSRRQRVEELLTSAEQNREAVKEDIYQRVTSDYRAQLEAILGEYHPLRERVVAQLRTVRSEELLVRQLHGAIQDELAEVRFRCSVGEFGEDKLRALEQEKESDSQRLEEQLAIVEKTYEIARELLGEDVEAALADSPSDVAVNYDRTVPMSTVQGGPPPPPPGEDSGSTSVVDSVEMSSAEVASRAEAPSEPPEAGDDQGSAAGPSTAAVDQPRLRRSGTKAGNKSFLLSPEGQLVLGRSTTCDVVIQGATVSRRHAIITCREGCYHIEDISSGGGILVNGERVKEHELQDGDEISIAASVFHFNAP